MKKDFIILLILIFPAIAWLFQPGYFSMHDDLQTLRQYEQDKCFADGQVPCRWVLDMGYGYGYPLFNFYPPLPYLVGQPFSWIGLPYIEVVKIVGVIGFIVTAFFMYILGRELWGRSGGFVSSLFYTYAPYHSVDFWVRGAMNEFWAMAFYPAIFYSTYKLIQTHAKKYIPYTALSVAGLMLSHNPMLKIFAPVLILWCLFWLWKFRTFQPFGQLTIAAIWALGLAAFFTLPVVFEQKFVSVWTLTSGYFNYLAHYLDIRQIFFWINWGYGSSELGPADSMSFALGYLHWLIPIAILILAVFVKRIRSHLPLLLLLSVFILGSLFMTHSKSTFIWKLVKPLEFLQFPWRFLTLSVFAASLLSGAMANIFNKKILIPVILALLIIMNGNYFRPREWYPNMTDAQKFSGKSWQLLITSGIFDYLPIFAPFPPADPALTDANIIEGIGGYTTLVKKTNLQKYSFEVTSPLATAELQTYYFPGWEFWLDGQEVKNYELDEVLGRPQITLTSGSHELIARFTNTPIRILGNTLTVISLLALIAYCFLKPKVHPQV